MFVARAQYIANHSWTLNNQEVPLRGFIPYYERPLRTTTSDTYAVMQGSGSSPRGSGGLCFAGTRVNRFYIPENQCFTCLKTPER